MRRFVRSGRNLLLTAMVWSSAATGNSLRGDDERDRSVNVTSSETPPVTRGVAGDNGTESGLPTSGPRVLSLETMQAEGTAYLLERLTESNARGFSDLSISLVARAVTVLSFRRSAAGLPAGDGSTSHPASSAQVRTGSARDVLRAARSWLRGRQRTDGFIASGDQTTQVTWYAIAALETSDETIDLAAAKRARDSISAQVNRTDALLARDDLRQASRLRRAFQFLQSQSQGSPEIPYSVSSEALSADDIAPFTGGVVNVRSGYRDLQETFASGASRLVAAFGLVPSGGLLQEYHLAARILSLYANPWLVDVRGDVHHWPTVLTGRIRRLVDTNTGAWRAGEDGSGDEPDFAATAEALLTLSVLSAWSKTGTGRRLDPRAESATVDRVADLNSDCVGCHRGLQPHLVYQWEESRHSSARVGCEGCHGTNHSSIFRVRGRVSARTCSACHEKEAREFAASSHAHAEETLVRSALFATTPSASREACFGCHRVGSKHSDGSRGSCNFCHTGHLFSAAAAREPEACTGCHTGEDYPQDLAYQLSKHGALYAQTRDPAIAPTCASCHQPEGFHGDAFGITIGGSGVGGIRTGRTAPIPMKEVGFDDFTTQRAAMVAVCSDCHSSRFAGDHLKRADAVKAEGDRFLTEAAETIRGLHVRGRIGDAGELELGGNQVRVAPDVRGSAILNKFYRMWRFDYAWTWKGAYHFSPSVTALQSRPGLRAGVAAIRETARQLEAERKQ